MKFYNSGHLILVLSLNTVVDIMTLQNLSGLFTLHLIYICLKTSLKLLELCCIHNIYKELIFYFEQPKRLISRFSNNQLGWENYTISHFSWAFVLRSLYLLANLYCPSNMTVTCMTLLVYALRVQLVLRV